MTGSRWLCAALAALVAAAPADAGLFTKKPKSEAQVRRLTDTLRTDADEKKRRAAVAELKDADPRTHPDVIPALVAALRHDPSPPVRADAAELIGQLKPVFPVAGVALETAAESDPSPAVRDAAKQALWEYHVNGYRSARGADGIAGQTPEPPIARPATRPAAAVVRPDPVPPVRQAVEMHPPALPPVVLPTVTSSPTRSEYTPAPEETRKLPGPRIILTVERPPQLNVTAEPPIAAPPVYPVAPPPRPGVGRTPGLGVPVNVPRSPRFQLLPSLGLDRFSR